MYNHIIRNFALAVIIPALFSCQSDSSNNNQQKDSTSQKTSTAVQSIKPNESGYADVNGLKMYYEVYGEGKPLVLVHGSYMNIIMNWSHIIPLLAKTVK